jgi:hypothetical protein
MDALQDEFLMLPKRELGDTQTVLNCYTASEVMGAMKKLT